jgi:DNA-binding CsgD family transcriptional regulator
VLESFGLTRLTESVYRLVLAEPSWGVRELVAHLHTDEATVRACLDELADLALLRPSWDEPGSLRPVSPQVGLAALVARAEADIAERQHRMERARAAMLAVAAEHDTHRDQRPLTVLRGLDEVRGRLEELAESAVREVCSLTPGPAHHEDTHSAGRSASLRPLERGVLMRGLYLDSFRNDPATIDYLRWMTGHGGQVRTVPTLPIMMIIVDRQTALVPLDPDESRLGAVEVTAPGVVAALHALFEQMWAAGTPFGQRAVPVDGLTGQERELIQILAEGATDETAARRLGVSLRTVRRMMAHLMERLDAQSRFQAGVLAAAQGWPGRRR